MKNNFNGFIEKVTAEDMKRIANRLLNSKPSVVGYGKLKKMPDYEKIEKVCMYFNVNF